ncbi:MAG: PorP/SprF family type IX secretion system membrane protein [Bacteroidia bacterium]
MKNNLKIYYTGIIIIIANLLNITESAAQDARFAQSYSNPLLLNPAIMGANRDMKIGMNYRSQWSAAAGGYKTFAFTGLYPIIPKNSNDKFDVGVNILTDKAGAFSTMDFSIALDYSKELAPNNNVCLSLMGGYIQKSLNMNDQIFDNQFVNGAFNAGNPSGEATFSNKVSHPDLGFGFMWFYNPDRATSKINAFIGISGFHLNQPNESMMKSTEKLPMRFSYQAGIKIFSGKKLDISPNVRVNNQDGNMEPAAGVYVDYHLNENFKLVVGGWYRGHDAMAVLVGFDHKNYSIGYSYDLISSGLNNATNDIRGSEITLSIKLKPFKKKKNLEEVKLDENGLPVDNTKPYSNPFSSF